MYISFGPFKTQDYYLSTERSMGLFIELFGPCALSKRCDTAAEPGLPSQLRSRIHIASPAM
jgi:hypothetical protein